MAAATAPEVDMLMVSKSSRANRRAILGFAPKIGLSIVNYSELDHIDNFYLDCQNYRDYYRDPYDKLARPDMFQRHQGKCGIKLDRSVEMLRRPISWVVEPQPIVFPIEYSHNMNLDKYWPMTGHYNRDSCIKYKR